ncbi:hypothetical protein LHJ74_14470 [Streptomyces sp. N2-109]|uniref:Transmembrane protein n=1 Tax=Streptomyces gossypii TaxID=2883101 RepID=A0ABT2JTB2_9ACTN|nr:hypothetical protein [Streptomyces gossypii]MCT2591098.1 hypothetical protein [Streptomyces gossypii]
MTALAITVLIIWGIGSIGMCVALPTVTREHPELATVHETAPAAYCLLAAMLIVFWPAAVIASAVLALARRWNR